MKQIFTLPFEPFTDGEKPKGHDERIIEIPWTLSCIDRLTDKRVLDVGYAYAEPRYIEPLCRMRIEELHGVDRAPRQDRLEGYIKDKMITSEADIRNPLFPKPYEKHYFDLILCISTIEHVGLDNKWYFTDDDMPRDEWADKVALKNLIDILRVGGKLALTVPYGVRELKGQFRVYNKEWLANLVDLPNISVLRRDMFVYKGSGWYTSTDELDFIHAVYGRYGFISSTGLACLLLEKTNA